MADETEKAAERILASLPDTVLSRLADLIASKLTKRNAASCFPSRKSRVRISSPAPGPFFSTMCERQTACLSAWRYNPPIAFG